MAAGEKRSLLGQYAAIVGVGSKDAGKIPVRSDPLGQLFPVPFSYRRWFGIQNPSRNAYFRTHCDKFGRFRAYNPLRIAERLIAIVLDFANQAVNTANKRCLRAMRRFPSQSPGMMALTFIPLLLGSVLTLTATAVVLTLNGVFNLTFSAMHLVNRVLELPIEVGSWVAKKVKGDEAVEPEPEAEEQSNRPTPEETKRQEPEPKTAAQSNPSTPEPTEPHEPEPETPEQSNRPTPEETKRQEPDLSSLSPQVPPLTPQQASAATGQSQQPVDTKKVDDCLNLAIEIVETFCGDRPNPSYDARKDPKFKGIPVRVSDAITAAAMEYGKTPTQENLDAAFLTALALVKASPDSSRNMDELQQRGARINLESQDKNYNTALIAVFGQEFVTKAKNNQLTDEDFPEFLSLKPRKSHGISTQSRTFCRKQPTRVREMRCK